MKKNYKKCFGIRRCLCKANLVCSKCSGSIGIAENDGDVTLIEM